jgi:hypothetical protein
MTRRTSRRRRQFLNPRAPRRGTLIVASILYIVGLFGELGFFNVPHAFAVAALAIAGGLLILGVMLRGL